MRSEIFNEYAKICEERGLVKTAEEESKALKDYKSDPYARAGSDDISTIEALYCVKPDNSIEYENNIMEAAHKHPVVTAPSYDKLNGLVENNIERQQATINMVMKPCDGTPTGRKYARKELLMELVRIANDMDNQGKEELRKAADKCIDGLIIKKKS